jgi:hypothetical protein
MRYAPGSRPSEARPEAAGGLEEKLTPAGKPVAGATVRLIGAGVNKLVKTGKNGVVVVSVKSS